MSRGGFRILACIPAYNEAKNIPALIEKIKPYVTEIIICDDGSVDNTSEVATKAGATVIRHTLNRGYGGAIKTLFLAAKERDPDVMVTIDADGQHDPDQLPRIIEPILNCQADIMIGSRFLVKTDSDKVPLYRTIGIKAITKLAHMVSYNDITDAQSGFRAYNKNALSLELKENGMAVSTEILVRAKDRRLRIKETPITIRYDVDDASTHNPISHGLGIITSIIKFISVRHPLAFYGISGLAFLIVAGIFATMTVELYSKEGFFSLNMAVLAIGLGLFGLILIVAGIVFYVMVSTGNRKR